MKALQLPRKLFELFTVEHQDRARALLSVLALSATLGLMSADALKRFEYVLYDYRFHFKDARPSDPRIVAIEISDDSIAKIGRWPWGRDWHATLIQALTDMGASAIVFDVVFSEPSAPEKDAALEEAIRRSGKVYLAEVIEGGLRGEGERTLLTSLPELTRASRGAGHINIEPDIDGVMRRIPLAVDLKGVRIPQLALSVAMDEYGVRPEHVHYEGRDLVVPFPSGGGIRVPTDGRGNYLIHWVGPWAKTFTHYSYVDIITSYAAIQKGDKPVLPIDAFRNKICFVGVSASGLYDIRPTPLEPAYPAVGVNLTIYDNLMSRRFLKPMADWQSALLLLVVFGLMLRILRMKSYFRCAFSILGAMVGYVSMAFFVFRWADVWVSVVYPVFLMMIQSFVVTVYNQIAITVERTKLVKLATRDSLTGLYNIGHFKLLLKAEITTISMRREKSLSIIMGDVDNFKKTNDTYGHLTGDQVLKEVAATVKANCRALDVAARYGGEEFIVMLPGANIDEAFKVADKIRKSINMKVYFNEKGDFQTSISIGVTQVDPDEKDIDAIIARADRALYTAKHTGKNKVVVATDSPIVHPEKPSGA
ncbi:MAG: hypothetical protein MOGMAGMI_01135 [Candidatus Omnitrophica bacterium]|nr:hypothetical protein [Candidatus Omnitrophota bacterium]